MQYLKQAVAGAQILFVAFGAMVLVPLLTGFNPAIPRLRAGIGCGAQTAAAGGYRAGDYGYRPVCGRRGRADGDGAGRR